MYGESFEHFSGLLNTLYLFQDDLESDSVVRGRLIMLQSKDGHAQWVSKAMLEKMLPLPEEVDGGIIVRDQDGNPTGQYIFPRSFSITH